MSLFYNLALAAALTLPSALMAAGSSDGSPPATTPTTTTCTDGKVWDEKTKACTDAKSGALDDDALYQAARELAYAGQQDAALYVLSAMSEGDTDRVLTYKGFANRKAGRIADGMRYYQAALKLNPDNLLARSYMGQGLVAEGKLDLARVQLDEIVARGGAGGWPEKSLRSAIATRTTYSY